VLALLRVGGSSGRLNPWACSSPPTCPRPPPLGARQSTSRLDRAGTASRSPNLHKRLAGLGGVADLDRTTGTTPCACLQPSMISADSASASRTRHGVARDYVPGIGGGPGEIGGHAFSSLGPLEVSVLVVGNDHEPFTQHGGIDLRSRFRHSADAFGTSENGRGGRNAYMPRTSKRSEGLSGAASIRASNVIVTVMLRDCARSRAYCIRSYISE
jgi:hypothetical protein